MATCCASRVFSTTLAPLRVRSIVARAYIPLAVAAHVGSFPDRVGFTKKSVLEITILNSAASL